MHSASGFVVLDYHLDIFSGKPGFYIDTTYIFYCLRYTFFICCAFPEKEQLSPIKAKHSAPILFVILIQFWLSDTIRVDDNYSGQSQSIIISNSIKNRTMNKILIADASESDRRLMAGFITCSCIYSIHRFQSLNMSVSPQ